MGRDSGGVEGSLTCDDLFFTLSNERRRHVLSYLREHDGEATVRELVSHVAARERGVSPGEVTYSQRKSVYVSLRQTHLPKLDALGIVSFDINAGTVSLSEPTAAEFDFYYERVPQGGLLWGEFYLGLAVVLATVVGAATLGLYPFSLFAGTTLAWVVLVVFAATAAVHTVRTRERRLDVGLPWSDDDATPLPADDG